MKGKKKKQSSKRVFIRPYTGRMIYGGPHAADRRRLGYKQRREKTFTAFRYRIVVMLRLRAPSDAIPLPPPAGAAVCKQNDGVASF